MDNLERLSILFFMIILYDVFDITIIKHVLLKMHCMARLVSENYVLGLELEKSRMFTKWKQSQAKIKRVFGNLENSTDNRNSLYWPPITLTSADIAGNEKGPE